MKKTITLIATALMTFVSANAQDMIDMGFPSGVKWASRFIGAAKDGAIGEYYAFGETSKKDTYSYDTYNSDLKSKGTKSGSYFYFSNSVSLTSKQDVATVKLGKEMRLPTAADVQELMDNTTCELNSQKNAVIFKSTKNGASITLPMTGYVVASKTTSSTNTLRFWTSTCYKKDAGYWVNIYYAKVASSKLSAILGSQDPTNGGQVLAVSGGTAGIEGITVDEDVTKKVTKTIVNGKIVIEKNGHKFNAAGQKLSE